MKTRFISICFAFFAVACGGDEDDDGMMMADPTFTRVQSEVFDISCTLSSCHDAIAPTGDLELTAGVAYGQLVGVDAVQVNAAAMGFKRVVASDVDNSFLVQKLQSTLDTDTFEDIMPQGTNGLDAARLQLIEDWIAAGALDN